MNPHAHLAGGSVVSLYGFRGGAQSNLVDALFGAVRSLTAPSLVLRLDVVSDQACIVSGVPDAWEDALRELMRNAAAATPDGAQVHVSLRAGDHGVRITVSDTGVGDAPARLATVAEGPALEELRDVVQAAGGALAMESGGPRPGTRIEIFVPTLDDAGSDDDPPLGAA
jgi:signal transduction histidine kinase